MKHGTKKLEAGLAGLAGLMARADGPHLPGLVPPVPPAQFMVRPLSTPLEDRIVAMAMIINGQQ